MSLLQQMNDMCSFASKEEILVNELVYVLVNKLDRIS